MSVLPREGGREAPREVWNVDHPAYVPRAAPAELPPSQCEDFTPIKSVLYIIKYAHTHAKKASLNYKLFTFKN